MLKMAWLPWEESLSIELNTSPSPKTTEDRIATTIIREIMALFRRNPPQPVRKAVQMVERAKVDMQNKAVVK
jgi:hypothetical protein